MKDKANSADTDQTAPTVNKILSFLHQQVNLKRISKFQENAKSKLYHIQESRLEGKQCRSGSLGSTLFYRLNSFHVPKDIVIIFQLSVICTL